MNSAGMAKRRCSANGCTNLQRSRLGLCNVHRREGRLENPSICSIAGCGRPLNHRATMLCRMHRKRLIRSGGVDTTSKSFEQRWSELAKPANGCWHWNGPMEQGYGRTSHCHADGTRHKCGAHVAAWEKEHGPVPPRMDVGHTCHDKDLSCPGGIACQHRSCVRPDHLELQSRRHNLLAAGPRGAGAKMAARPSCSKGHLFVPENTRVSSCNARICLTCQTERTIRYREKHGLLVTEKMRGKLAVLLEVAGATA
jgi:hypothetical protein